MFKAALASLAGLAGLAAGPAAAQCEDLWFSRNHVFAQAGYCFASPLGRAVFGTAGCTGTDVALSPDAAALVAYVRRMEAELGCAVDTSQTVLNLPNIGLRLQLEAPVAPSEFASGCLGWTGAPIALLSAPRDDAPQIALAHPGDDIAWEYEAIDWPDGWTFLSTYRDGAQVGLGWAPDTIDYDLCTGLAG